MKQQSLSDIEYANRRRKTKRERFLEAMNEIIPWSQWIDIIRPYYYNNKRGHRPKDIEVMLRMYLMQNWFNLSDEGMEEAIYDSYAMRSFLGINFIDEQVSDATTLLKFRHLLEQHHTCGRKQGFSAPDSSWFRKDSYEYVRNILYDSKSRIYNYLDKSSVMNIFKRHCDGLENRRLFIWSIINFEQWLKLFM